MCRFTRLTEARCCATEADPLDPSSRSSILLQVYYLKVLVSYMCCYNTQEKMDTAYALDPWESYLVYTQVLAARSAEVG